MNHSNAFFSVQCLIVGTRILGYNLATEQLTPAPKVPIESVIIRQSCNVKNLIWPKKLEVVPFCIAGHIYSFANCKALWLCMYNLYNYHCQLVAVVVVAVVAIAVVAAHALCQSQLPGRSCLRNLRQATVLMVSMESFFHS